MLGHYSRGDNVAGDVENRLRRVREDIDGDENTDALGRKSHRHENRYHDDQTSAGDAGGAEAEENAERPDRKQLKPGERHAVEAAQRERAGEMGDRSAHLESGEERVLSATACAGEIALANARSDTRLRSRRQDREAESR